jgi:hypothetical protein
MGGTKRQISTINYLAREEAADMVLAPDGDY